MSNAASGLAHLKPFLPGLEPLLVSEIMINGPGMFGSKREAG